MNEIITLARPTCFLCSRMILKGSRLEVEIHTLTDPRPTRVIICKRCYEEIFGTPQEENTDAKKER